MILTILFTTLSALYDKGKRFVDHKPRFIFRAFIVGLISLIGVSNVYGYFVNFAQNTAIFYLLFDYILNLLEGRKWNYIGSTAIHDRVWVKHLGGWIPQLIFKLILLTITIYIQ